MGIHQVMQAVIEQSVNCERMFIALDSERAGFALVGPNSVMWAWVMVPELPNEFSIFDLYLN
jgi:hypothetical protein